MGKYSLKLVDNDVWDLYSAGKQKSWLQKFAKILTLNDFVQGSKNRVFFVDKKSKKEWHKNPVYALPKGLRTGLPTDGWSDNLYGCLKIWYNKQCRAIICELSEEGNNELEIIKMWHALTPIYINAIEKGGLPFHCGFVVKDGIGYLISAPGNTGKSTCCRRIPQPWNAVCDDEVLIIKQGGKYFVHPFPTWSDYLWRGSKKTWKTEESYPLGGIFFLEQAAEDQAENIGEGQAAIFINQGTNQICSRIHSRHDEEGKAKIKAKLFDNSCKLAKKIPCYILRATLDGNFWEEMESVLSNKKVELLKC